MAGCLLAVVVEGGAVVAIVPVAAVVKVAAVALVVEGAAVVVLRLVEHSHARACTCVANTQRRYRLVDAVCMFPRTAVVPGRSFDSFLVVRIDVLISCGINSLVSGLSRFLRLLEHPFLLPLRFAVCDRSPNEEH